MKLTITLLQLEVSHLDIEGSLNRLDYILSRDEAAKGGIAVLPELWPGGFNRERLSYFAQHEDLFLKGIKSLAKKRGMYIAVPIVRFFQPRAGTYQNDFIFISPKGEILSSYHKIHLFPLTDEPTLFDGGKLPVYIQLESIKIGFATCYDIRFPSLFRYYARHDVSLVIVSACFPEPRQEQWLTLARARAIENQFYLAGVNAVGSQKVGDQKLKYFGRSCLIGPHGDQLLQFGDQEEVQWLEIDTAKVSQARDTINYTKEERVRYV